MLTMWFIFTSEPVWTSSRYTYQGLSFLQYGVYVVVNTMTISERSDCYVIDLILQLKLLITKYKSCVQNTYSLSVTILIGGGGDHTEAIAMAASSTQCAKLK